MEEQENPEINSMEENEVLDYYKETIEGFRKIINRFDEEKDRLQEVIKSINVSSSQMPSFLKKMYGISEDKSLPPAFEVEPVPYEEDSKIEITEAERKKREAQNLAINFGEIVKSKKHEYDFWRDECDKRINNISKLPKYIRRRYFASSEITKMVDDYNGKKERS